MHRLCDLLYKAEDGALLVAVTAVAVAVLAREGQRGLNGRS